MAAVPVHPAALGQQKEEKDRASGSAAQGFQVEVALPDLQWIWGLSLETISKASLNKLHLISQVGRKATEKKKVAMEGLGIRGCSVAGQTRLWMKTYLSHPIYLPGSGIQGPHEDSGRLL